MELTDWTCEFGDLLMGADDSPVSIVAVDGLLTLPEIRSSDLALVQRDGLWPGEDFMSGRPVTLTLEIYGQTREEFTDALSQVQAAFMPGRPEAPLKFRFPGVAGDRDGFVMVRPRKRSAPLDLNFANRVCIIVVELYSTSPYVYGLTDREATVWSKTDTDASPVTRVVQRGSVLALPRIVITGATNPVLTSVYKGHPSVISVTHTGTVVIDSAAKTVKDDAGNSLATSGSSEWPEYAPGEHLLTLQTSGTGTAKAVVTWSEMWM